MSYRTRRGMEPKAPSDMALEELLELPAPSTDPLCQPPKTFPSRISGLPIVNPFDTLESHKKWLRKVWAGSEQRFSMRDLSTERPWCPDGGVPSAVMAAHAGPSSPNPKVGAFDPDEVDWHFYQQAVKQIEDAAERNERIVHEDGTYLTEEVLKSRQLLQNRGSIEEIEARLRAKGKIGPGEKHKRLCISDKRDGLVNFRASLAALVADYCDENLDEAEKTFVEDVGERLKRPSKKRKRRSRR